MAVCRGRCYLLSTSTNEEAIERLKFLETTTDGYDVSKYDLKLRGPGEVLGARQSGIPTFLGDVVADFDLMKLARDDAVRMIHDYYKYGEFGEDIAIIKQNLKTNNEYVD